MTQSQILVLPRECLPQHKKFLPWSHAAEFVRCADASKTWLARDLAESSTDWIQPIACAVIRDRQGGYFVLRRISHQPRTDLRGRLSIVVGGHVDRIDLATDFTQIIVLTLQRELEEEVGATKFENISPLGIVIDDASKASSRHIAIAFSVAMEHIPKTRASEEFYLVGHKHSGIFHSAQDLGALYAELDPWSAILFEQLIASEQKLRGHQMPLPGVFDEAEYKPVQGRGTTEHSLTDRTETDAAMARSRKSEPAA